MTSLIFLKDNFSIILYGVALILSILQYGKYYDTKLKYLPILIGYTFLTEILGMLIRLREEFAIIFSEGFSYYNSLIYNIFDIIFYLYFFYIYWHILKKPLHKTRIKNGVIFFVALSLINPLFQNFLLSPQVFSMIAGSVILVYSAIAYLNQISHYKSKINYNLLYWVSLGLVLFYPISPIIFIIAVYFDNSLYQDLHLASVLQILICLMYTCFIIGFLKMHRMKPIDQNS